MTNQTLDRKGIFSFLIITFAVTYLIEGLLILRGFRVTQVPALNGQLLIAAVMWVPGIAAIVTAKLITREGFANMNLRFGPWRAYLTSGLLVPLGFVVIYLLTWLLGLGQPDWQFTYFRDMLASAGTTIPEGGASPALVIPMLFLVTVIFAPIFNGVLGFGEELGWRGYLLPKLMPLGKWKSYTILAVIWGLWHLPLLLVGFVYPGQPVLGTITFIVLLFAFGIYVNEMSLRHRSCILAGWIHGLFNSQKLGIWALLFPAINPMLGGYAGICGIVVWLGVGMVLIRRNVRSGVLT
jgi:membrane protease YdiL (CAAX protease family)